MVPEKVLKAFDGTLDTQPLRVSVKFKGLKERIFVRMGEIEVPAVVKEVNLEQLEREHECRITKRGNFYIVTPNFVFDIIKKEGLLSSVCDEHRKKLRKWMTEHGCVVRQLVGLE